MDVVVEIVTYWLSKEQRAGEDLCRGGGGEDQSEEKK